jgi:sugar-specific transcriptional regulator TrmB
MEISKLIEMGLSSAEATIYYAVVKLGNCSVRDISKESGFHRTNIYDVLEQLKEKGLIVFYSEGKTMKYGASDPSNLKALIKEKEEILNSFLPELLGLYKNSKDEIQVEVFKGNEGMKSAWRDMINEGKPLYGYGVKGQLREKLPIFAEQWLRDVKNKKIPLDLIYTKRGDLPRYYSEVRYVSEEFSSPVAILIYGDKVNINIWEPSLMCIVIKSKLVASMYKKHFDLMWKVAKK